MSSHISPTKRPPFILARILRPVREHDWFTALMELVLLITGIFVGFQLDRWNDERLDQMKADEYREQLIADLSVERDDVHTLIAYHEQVRAFALTALDAWSDTPEADAEQLIVALYQASNILPVTSVRGAYDAIANNGLIDLVGGPGLASKLSAYYGQPVNSLVNDEKRYRMELRGVMPIAVQAQIRNDCIRQSVDAGIMEQLSTDCSLGIKQAEAEQIIADIVSHPDMLAYLRQAISRDSVSIDLLNSKRDLVDGLLAELNSLGEKASQD